MIEEKEFRVVISNKVYPISIEMRPIWRVCLIVISIMAVSGDKKYLDFKKLNILVWMLIRVTHWDEYIDFLKGVGDKVPFISVDTATYRAIELASAKGLISIADGRIAINELGENLYAVLIKHEIMQDEIEFLSEFGRKLTEKKVELLTGGAILC